MRRTYVTALAVQKALIICLAAVTCRTVAQPLQGSNPYFAPYLAPGELPDGGLMPLFQEIWRVMGSQLMTTNFTAKVDQVSKTIFAAYSYHGQAMALMVSKAAPTQLDGHPVNPLLLTGDAVSDSLFSNYNSVDVQVTVTIDNKAWYPDLGSVATTNHNRLANILNSEGYIVEAWLCSSYVLSENAKQVLAHMPIPVYTSSLMVLKVTGQHLVPMTIQKQNVITAVLADLLSFAEVWYIRCTAVNQASPHPGQNVSSAFISFVVQQDASALSVGQALMSVINDTLGVPLFDSRMATVQLPMSATLDSITNYPGESITDQVNSTHSKRKMEAWKVAIITITIALTMMTMAYVMFATWTKKCSLWQCVRVRRTPQNQVELQCRHSISQTDSSITVNQQSKHSSSLLHHVKATLTGDKSSLARTASLSTIGLMTTTVSDSLSDSLEAPFGVTQSIVTRQAGLPPHTSASHINPDDIQLCRRPNGEHWVLGAGTFGVVYKARRGLQDVAVKTINTQVIYPQGPYSQGWRGLQKELDLHKVLSYDKNLVQFYGSCVKHGLICLVLELMEGGDMRQALQSSAGKEQLQWYMKGASIALDIIKGLHFLHSHSVLHRDIKSGNVLLSKDLGVAKICDMGLSHIMGNTSKSLPAAQATFAYAAPEMLMNQRCDHKADIFSYGVVLWEMITQETPRRGHLRDFQVPEECPQAVATLVDACLDLAPENRPSTQHIFDVISQTTGISASAAEQRLECATSNLR